MKKTLLMITAVALLLGVLLMTACNPKYEPDQKTTDNGNEPTGSTESATVSETDPVPDLEHGGINLPDMPIEADPEDPIDSPTEPQDPTQSTPTSPDATDPTEGNSDTSDGKPSESTNPEPEETVTKSSAITLPEVQF